MPQPAAVGKVSNPAITLEVYKYADMVDVIDNIGGSNPSSLDKPANVAIFLEVGIAIKQRGHLPANLGGMVSWR